MSARGQGVVEEVEREKKESLRLATERRLNYKGILLRASPVLYPPRYRSAKAHEEVGYLKIRCDGKIWSGWATDSKITHGVIIAHHTASNKG